MKLSEKETMDVEVGDTVRFLVPGILDGEGEEWTKKDGLKINNDYTVSAVGKSKYGVHSLRVCGSKCNYTHNVGHFKRIE